MRRVIDILKAAASREIGADPLVDASDISEKAGARFHDVRTETESSRSPVAMRRQDVRADLSRMMRIFGVKSSSLRLYQDELAEAEYSCALCQHVGRCRAWSAKGNQGDAPRLFCANVALFEEISPDPIWSEAAPGSWHADTKVSPALRLLESVRAAPTEAPPKLGARKLERFMTVAMAIDALFDRWGSSSDAPGQTVEFKGRDIDPDVEIDKLFDHLDGIAKADFARILHVALCDRRLARYLCQLHDRWQQKAGIAQMVAD